jgi:pimeloyl-ACP methyl ester carboxylesterase
MSERRPVSFVASGGLRLVGDGHGSPAAPPVVLLAGGGQTRHAWGGTAAKLGRRGWYAITVDQRGHGDSEWASDGDYTIERYADDLRAVCAQLPAPPAIVGASLGGIAALLAVGEDPAAAVAAIVLVDIAPRIQLEGVGRIVAFMNAHPEGFASLDEAGDAVAAYLHHRPRPKDTKGLEKNLRLGADGRWRWHWDPRFMNGRRAGMTGERLEEAARRLDVPTLLVRGRMSDVVSEEDARAFLAVAPNARYIDVSGAGHMVAGDRNDRFTEAVVEFLSGVHRAPR